MKRFSIVFFALLCPLLAAQTGDYQWFQTDLFPYVISSGPDKGTGAADLAMDLLDKAISDYPHERLTKPAIRILEELKEGYHGLWPTAIRTPEREGFLYYSEPYAVINPQKFVTLAGSNVPGAIDGTTFTRNGDYEVALVRGRAYGNVINAILEDIPPGRKTEVTSLAGEFTRILKLMEANRVTGFFAYEDEVNALCKTLGIAPERFSFSRVRSLEYIYASVAAPRTPWGLAVIGRINGAIDTIKGPVALKYMEFLPPASREEYLKNSRLLLDY